GVGTRATVQVTFSEPVTVAGTWFRIACATSATRDPSNSAVSGRPTTYTIDPTADFAPGERCTATIVAAQVRDQDALDPPDTPAADHTFGFTVDNAPAIAGTSPANGAAGVPVGSTITVA